LIGNIEILDREHLDARYSYYEYYKHLLLLETFYFFIFFTGIHIMNIGSIFHCLKPCVSIDNV
jgi:hypothetical protein